MGAVGAAGEATLLPSPVKGMMSGEALLQVESS